MDTSNPVKVRVWKNFGFPTQHTSLHHLQANSKCRWGKQNWKNNTIMMFTEACDRENMAVAMGYSPSKHVFVWCKVCISKHCQLLKQKKSIYIHPCDFSMFEARGVKVWVDLWSECLHSKMEGKPNMLAMMMWGSACSGRRERKKNTKKIRLERTKWVKIFYNTYGRKSWGDFWKQQTASSFILFSPNTKCSAPC